MYLDFIHLFVPAEIIYSLWIVQHCFPEWEIHCE